MERRGFFRRLFGLMVGAAAAPTLSLEASSLEAYKVVHLKWRDYLVDENHILDAYRYACMPGTLNYEINTTVVQDDNLYDEDE